MYIVFGKSRKERNNVKIEKKKKEKLYQLNYLNLPKLPKCQVSLLLFVVGKGFIIRINRKKKNNRIYIFIYLFVCLFACLINLNSVPLFIHYVTASHPGCVPPECSRDKIHCQPDKSKFLN